jgi:hypothetical protein
MKPEHPECKTLEDVKQLTRCFIKVTFPDLTSGLWCMSSLNKIVTTKVRIRCLVEGMQGVVYDTNIDADLRNIHRQYCTNFAVMPNIERQKYSKKSIVYWMPLIPEKEPLDKFISTLEAGAGLDNYQAEVEYTLCDSITDLCALDEGETDILAAGPILVEFKTFDTDIEGTQWGCSVSF